MGVTLPRHWQGMNSVALFLLRTAKEREDLSFWLMDALATTVIPGHWQGMSHISANNTGVVSLRCGMHGMSVANGNDSSHVHGRVLACDPRLVGCLRPEPRHSAMACHDAGPS